MTTPIRKLATDLVEKKIGTKVYSNQPIASFRDGLIDAIEQALDEKDEQTALLEHKWQLKYDKCWDEAKRLLKGKDEAIKELIVELERLKSVVGEVDFDLIEKVLAKFKKEGG